jgi:hypothetical protein
MIDLLHTVTKLSALTDNFDDLELVLGRFKLSLIAQQTNERRTSSFDPTEAAQWLHDWWGDEIIDEYPTFEMFVDEIHDTLEFGIEEGLVETKDHNAYEFTDLGYQVAETYAQALNL